MSSKPRYAPGVTMGGPPDAPHPVNAKGQRICGRPRGKLKTPCQCRILRANGCCQSHGGAVRHGVDHPRFKDGSKSKYHDFMPKAWQERAAAFAAAPGAKALREETALTGQLLADQLARLESMHQDAAAQGEVILEAAGLVEELRQGIEDGKRPAVHRALAELETRLLTGATTEQQRRARVDAEEEVRRTIDLRRKLADTEARIVEKRRAYVTVEELQAQLAGVAYRFAELAETLANRIIEGVVALGMEPAKVEHLRRQELVFMTDSLQRLSAPGSAAN